MQQGFYDVETSCQSEADNRTERSDIVVHIR